jgi:hypothetical protein
MEAPETLVERSQHVVVVCSHGVQVSSGGACQLSRAKRMPKSYHKRRREWRRRCRK